MPNPSQAAQQMNQKNKALSGQALIIQTYANSILQQPPVDFSGEPTLATYQTQINNGLTTAQTHATNYLNVIQPSIIQNISNIGNYYLLHKAVATTLSAGSTTTQWILDLTTLQQQSQMYQTAAKSVVTSLQTLQKELDADAASFANTVIQLNSAVNGDNGTLASLQKQVDAIQAHIDDDIAGSVISGLAIVGGGFLIAVGSVADFVTAGTSTPVVAGGVAVVAVGIAGEVAAAEGIKSLNDEKASLLHEEATLRAEVKLASGISGGYQHLNTQVDQAATAAGDMASAWETLVSVLKELISDLKYSTKTPGEVNTLFATTANLEVQRVLTEINTIQAQMAGVTTIVAQPGQTVGEAVVAAVQQQAAA